MADVTTKADPRASSSWRYVLDSFWAKAYARHVDRNPYPLVEPFALKDFEGRAWTLKDCLDKPAVFVFTSPHCEPCKAVYPVLSRLVPTAAQHVNLVLLSRGARHTNRSLAQEHHLDGVTVLGSRKHVERDWAVRATPWVFLIGRDRRSLYSGIASEEALTTLARLANHPVLRSAE